MRKFKMDRYDYLVHHGILGQKWGVRNGPPYPLGASAHSVAEKNAGWKQSLDKSSKLDYNKSAFGGITDYVPQETMEMAVAVLSTAAITTGYTAVMKFLKRNGERKFNKNVTNEFDLPKKKVMGSKDDDMKAVNPNYQTDNGYTQNCMYCSTVYDLRRRGYDVTANARKTGGKIKEVAEWYKGAKIESYKNSDEALRSLINQPDGARGNLSGMGQFGGHSVAYEVNNGNITIRDAQANKKWTWNEFTKRFNKSYYIIRTDNCEPNWEKIGETINPNSLKKGVK